MATDDRLARTVRVERILMEVAVGKRAPLTLTEYRDLALSLGKPSEYHTDAQRALLAEDRDAGRYRRLRAQHWASSSLAVVRNPKVAVKLGHECPSLDRLDALVDALEANEQCDGIEVTTFNSEVREFRSGLACPAGETAPEASDRESLAMYRSARDRADRLRALCDEMGEALESLMDTGFTRGPQGMRANAALAKWKESK